MTTVSVIALPYNALVTVDDIVRDSIDTVTIDTNNNQFTNAISEAILDVTGYVENYLDRQLVVRKYKQWIEYYDWHSTGTRYGTYECYALHWPIVEIVSVYSNTSKEIVDDDVVTLEEAPLIPKRYQRFITRYPGNYELEYYAGYKREHSTLTGIQAYTDPDDASETPLSGLTSLPPTLPYEIRKIVTELVLERLYKASNQLFGTPKRSGRTGDERTGVEANRDTGRFRHRLADLTKYRRVL